MIVSLQQRTVAITGASSGIGLATAVCFAQAGAGKLVLFARRLQKLEEVKQIIEKDTSTKVLAVQLDVTEAAMVKKVIADLPQEFKDIDVLAGLGLDAGPLDEIPTEAVDQTIKTNINGLVYITQAVLPRMRQMNRGDIINISSISGLEANPTSGIYTGTKHAVEGITSSLRKELVSTNIRVSSIKPGLVDTDFFYVRHDDTSDKAKYLLTGLEALQGEDIGDCAVFVANRPPRVQITDIVVLPTHQSGAEEVHRQ